MSKNYFTQETDDAIVKYNTTSDPIERNKIYEDKIHYPFFKLTQNLIHTFKFYNTDVDDLEHLQQEIIIFLISKLHLFHHSRNIQKRIIKIITKEFKEEYNDDFCLFTNDSPQVTQMQINDFISKLNISPECMVRLKSITPPKGYSYYGTIAKRWLIIYNGKNYNKKIVSTPISTLEENNDYSYTLDDNNLNNIVYHNDKISLFMDLYIEYCTDNIYSLFPKGSDAKIADAVLELFRKRESIEIFNKKALYIYIKEMIDVKTPKITKIADKLYDIFKCNYVFYLENGYIKFT